MKNLNTFIIERLKLTKDSKLQSQYNFFPIDFLELRELVENLLDERGKDADLNDIDVSKVESFCDSSEDLGLFEKLDPHNIDISKWNVSNVETMHGTFYRCRYFNCDLSKWNVSKVKDMEDMFSGCKNFNCDLSKWNVSNIENMNCMFYGCQNFDCDLSKWNVSNVEDMGYMFFDCTSLKNIPSWYKV